MDEWAENDDEWRDMLDQWIDQYWSVEKWNRTFLPTPGSDDSDEESDLD